MDTMLAAICFLAGCISVVFTILLFHNLFVFQHNWIIEPNKKVKFSSFIASALASIESFISMVYWILCMRCFEYHNYAWIFGWIMDPVWVISRLFWYFYLLFNIHNESQQIQVIKYALPKRWILIIKILLLIFAIIYPIWMLKNFYFRDALIEIEITILIFGMVLILFCDFSLLYIYIRSLHIYGMWWYSKCWQESRKYGISQRQHEILIRLTKFCVVCTIATIFDVLYLGICTWRKVDKSSGVIITVTIIQELSNITHTSAIYFSYKFGYESYLKVYGTLHRWFYIKCEQSHQEKVKNGYVQMDPV